MKQKIALEKNRMALEAALKDAKANVEFLCKNIGTTVGDIIRTSSNQYQSDTWVS